MNNENLISLRPFPELGPETVLNLVEAELDIPCSNLCRQLNSYINRVFELQTLDGSGLILKFYRPDRWSLRALQDEHDFLKELYEQEIPVIPPMQLVGGKTIAVYKDIFFSIFPYCGGRSSDEFTEDQWLEVGRLIGRSHAVGAVHPAKERMVLAPNHSTLKQVEFILASGVIHDPTQAQAFSSVCRELIAEIAPLFEEVTSTRIHGDCHFSNIIYRPGESFFLIDFDDMVMGPAVQDLWMLLPGSIQDSFLEIDLFLEGYETFHRFDRRGFRLIEALRGMRFLHYIAWLTHQFVADGSAPIVPGFGSKEYWIVEIADLQDQLERIRQDDEPFGNFF
jgi:Ser/Thr protein kinase RdoA (MazF antagonist)